MELCKFYRKHAGDMLQWGQLQHNISTNNNALLQLFTALMFCIRPLTSEALDCDLARVSDELRQTMRNAIGELPRLVRTQKCGFNSDCFVQKRQAEMHPCSVRLSQLCPAHMAY